MFNVTDEQLHALRPNMITIRASIHLLQATVVMGRAGSRASGAAGFKHKYNTRHKAARFGKGTNTQQQQCHTGRVSKKMGRPRGDHSAHAKQAWLPAVNYIQHDSLPCYSPHQNMYELPCAVGQHGSKHHMYASVRTANTSSSAWLCRVCSGGGSKPERVLYDVADKEVLVKQYAVEACSLSKRGPVNVCDSIDIYPSMKRWDLALVTPHGLLVEVMGEGHSSRLVTKPNNTDDSISTRQRRDYAYAQAAVEDAQYDPASPCLLAWLHCMWGCRPSVQGVVDAGLQGFGL